jgi:hypothetical protein
MSAVLNRDNIRAAIFGSENAKIKSKIVTFFGADVELRQSTIGSLDARTSGDEKYTIVGAIIENAYVPGTDEKVFDEGDRDMLTALPFGADIQRLTKAMNELSETDFLDTKHDSDATPGA